MQAIDLLTRPPGQIGVDPPRQHGVGLDVVGGPGAGAGARELHDAAFARRVGGSKTGAEDRHHRADIDDLAAAGRSHRGWTAWEHRKALVRLVWITLFHSAMSSACGGLRMLMPALLMRMSIRPSSPTTRLTMAATAALSVTSAATAIALAPLCSSSATAAADLASLRPTTAIAAPACARPRAMPSPMPPLPPVTMATLPVRSKGPVFMVVVRLFSGCAGWQRRASRRARHSWERADGHATLSPSYESSGCLARSGSGR